MKKNVMMRIASFLLVAVLITTCGISGTYAKYTSEATATATARVAEWKFTVDDSTENIAKTETFTFNLFATINEEDTTTAENDVAKDETIIAPGTGGSLGVVLKNESEVNATYSVAFTADEKDVPLKWSTDGVTWKDDISVLDLAAQGIDMNASVNVGLYWKWEFAGDDTADTALGIAGDAKPTVTLTITMTQVN